MMSGDRVGKGVGISLRGWGLGRKVCAWSAQSPLQWVFLLYLPTYRASHSHRDKKNEFRGGRVLHFLVALWSVYYTTYLFVTVKGGNNCPVLAPLPSAFIVIIRFSFCQFLIILEFCARRTPSSASSSRTTIKARQVISYCSWKIPGLRSHSVRPRFIKLLWIELNWIELDRVLLRTGRRDIIRSW